MNRLEFNEVMNAVDIYNPLSTTEGRYGTKEEVHYWNNLAISFGGSYYAIVNGRIPLEVANIIYEKYPGNPYDIRVEGGCNDWNPIDWATDEKYEREIQEYLGQELSSEDYIAKCKNASRNLKRRKNKDNKYLKTYHIDSKEGLIIFLTEMKDYFLRKNNLPETEVKKYNNLIAKVSSKILNKVNPTISAHDWMQGDEKNRDIYNASVERDKKTEIGQLFRKAISDFDKAVNPFINYSIEFDDVANYLEKVKITGITYNSKDGKYRKGCCRLELLNADTGNTTAYFREPDGFSFQLMYKLGEEQYLNVLHYFSTSGNYESDKGEVISINYFGDKTKNKIDIRFNITNGKAGETYKNKVPATMEQIFFVYDELLKAASYASEITIEKMKKDGNVKKLTINK